MLVDAAKEKQEGTQDQWQLESPFKEVLEQIKMSCNAFMMRRAYWAGRAGNWEGFKEEFRDKCEISEWAFARVKETFDKAASEDVGRSFEKIQNSLDKLWRLLPVWE